MNDILVTGTSGFLGRAVAARLPGAAAPGRAELDLTCGSAVRTWIERERPEIVVHCAARVGGITANMSRGADFLIDNSLIAGNLLAALREHPPRHLIVLLSTCMYPDRLPDDRYPMTEAMIDDGPPPPTNAPYAAAKRTLWRGATALHEQYGVPYTSLVPCNLYGPGDHYGAEGNHFMAAAIHRVETARAEGATRIEFMGTGIALRQFVFVSDLADLIAHFVTAGPANETLNIAPNGHAPVRDLVAAVVSASGYEGEVVFTGEGPDGQIRKDVTSARLRKVVPEWTTMETPLDEGLRLTIEAYRAEGLGNSETIA